MRKVCLAARKISREKNESEREREREREGECA